MASTAVRKHINALASALSSAAATANSLPALLSLRQQPQPLRTALAGRADLAALCADFGPRGPAGDLVRSHLEALQQLSAATSASGALQAAFEAQLRVCAALRALLAEAEGHNAHLGALQAVTLDLRLLAVAADRVQGGDGASAGGGGEGEEAQGAGSSGPLQRAMGELTICFRAVGNDRNEDMSMSKKLGMIFLFNHLFCIAFRINNFAFLNPLIKMMEREKHLFKRFAKAHVVTYRYYMGRKAMYDAKYADADEHLSLALQQCHRSSLKNKRLILIHLIPVNLLLGRLPKPELLRRYNLERFEGVVAAVRIGHLRNLQAELDKHQAFFMQWGIYLLLEKLKLVAYRNLFKRVYNLSGKGKRLALTRLLTALAVVDDEDVDMDEVECILANLIHQRYIKGYIAHTQKILVCSPDNAFPTIKKA